MTANAEQHVDINALQDLKEIMENEFETLINTFIQDSISKLAELEAAISAADADSLRKVAHSLKGSSSNICAGPMSDIAKQLEFLGKEGSVTGADGLLAKLKVEFATVQTLLQQNL